MNSIQNHNILQVIGFLSLVTLIQASNSAWADSYQLPGIDIDVIGRPGITQAYNNDSLPELARRYDVGLNELQLANPAVPNWTPDFGQKIRLPTRFLLPDAPRIGIVLNLPEMRLYHYQGEVFDKPTRVATYPVSIGQHDWQTPLGASVIVDKRENPTWTVPQSILKEAEKTGRQLPSVMPSGPDNPLGLFALSLDMPGYLLHGTNKPLGIGMRVTHGCIRLYPEDIETLFTETKLGTPVTIINQPVKLGWLGDDLFIEVHPQLTEFQLSESELFESAVQLLQTELSKNDVDIHTSLVRQAVRRQDGIPVLLTVQPGYSPFQRIH